MVERAATSAQMIDLRHVTGSTVVTTLEVTGYIDSTETNERFRPSPYIPAKLTTTKTTVNLADTAGRWYADYQLNDVHSTVTPPKNPFNVHLEVIVLILGLTITVFLVGLAARRV